MSDDFPVRSEADPDLLGAEGGEAAGAEQFVHGLLEHLARDDADAQGRRIETLMRVIDGAEREAPIRRVPSWPVLSGLAAAVLFLATLFFLLPAEQSALAVVQASIDATQSAGDRAYELWATPPGRGEAAPEMIGRLDLRGDDQYVIELDTPFGHRLAFGRDGDGSWAVHPDGRVDRHLPGHIRARWISMGERTLLVDSIDALLETLPNGYRLRRGPRAARPGETKPVCERITAAQSGPPGPGPQRIELWIDPATRLVQRMEMIWPERVAGERGERGERRPPGRARRGEAARGGPPPRRGDGPPRDGPPRDGPQRRRPPEWIDGAPDFERGRHPSPPRHMAFQRVDVPVWPDDWFSVEAHRLDRPVDP